MWTDGQIEAAATAAAEKANGGRFVDPLFYAPEHRDFWREVVRTALDAAQNASKKTKGIPQKASRKEVVLFSDHCAQMRSVYEYAIRLFRDSSAEERQAMEATAKSFFEDISQVLVEYIVNSACRITEQHTDPRGNENLSAALFVGSFSDDAPTHQKLTELKDRLDKHRDRILDARNKLTSHNDRLVINKGQPLAAATWDEWNDFWSALADFVRLINEKTHGGLYDINLTSSRGDVEAVLKKFG
jgi:hypothetical protein